MDRSERTKRCIGGSPIVFLVQRTAWALAAWLGALAPQAMAAHTIVGPEALVEFPKSAEWNMTVNFRPGDRDVADLNPPCFSWCYNPGGPTLSATDINEYTFQFQVAYEPTFTNLVVNKRTPSNLYNTVAPFTNGTAPIYWRVGYAGTDGIVRTWSATRSFTISPRATRWDRSMLADEAYLARKGVHPHLMFNASNRAALNQWLESKGGIWWGINKEWAHKTIDPAQTQWWTNSPLVGIDETVVPLRLANVAFMWQMTRNPIWSNAHPERVLTNVVGYYLKKRGDQLDIVGFVSQALLQSIGYCYDWLYDLMDTRQRAYVLSAIEYNVRYVQKTLWWKMSSRLNYHNGQGDTNRLYPAPYHVEYWSASKQGNSHGNLNHEVMMPAVFSAYGDSAEVRELFDLSINYLIGRTYPFGTDGALNQGRGYGVGGYFEHAAVFNTLQLHFMFPEAQWSLLPSFHRTADWLSRMLPVGFSQGTEPWGEGAWGRLVYWGRLGVGRDLAWLIGDGRAQLHHQNEGAIAPDTTPWLWPETLLVPFHLTAPAPVTNTVLAAPFLEDGWVLGSTHPPNTHAAFTNGLGFVLQARPRGAQPSAGTGHAAFSDLSYQLWAYGAPITDANEINLSAYGHVHWAHYGLLVDGLGQMQPSDAQIEPYYCRVMAFTNAPDFTYCAVDGTRAYPRSNFVNTVLWNTPYSYMERHNRGPLAKVAKVHRHLLFPRRKYFVIYDDMAALSNSTFTKVYHVLEDTLANVRGASFSYTVTNHTAGQPPVQVFVFQAVHSDRLSVVKLSGDRVKSNPITGENYWRASNLYPRNHAFWISNKSPGTDFHFMTVIYPVKPGAALPQITRLDDYTVEVRNGPEVDVISFDGQTRHPATMVVDLQGMRLNPVIAGRPSPPNNPRVVVPR